MNWLIYNIQFVYIPSSNLSKGGFYHILLAQLFVKVFFGVAVVLRNLVGRNSFRIIGFEFTAFQVIDIKFEIGNLLIK